MNHKTGLGLFLFTNLFTQWLVANRAPKQLEKETDTIAVTHHLRREDTFVFEVLEILPSPSSDKFHIC